MAKNSTLFSNDSFIPHGKKDMKKNPSQELPSDAVIKNILSFSKALKIEKSVLCGFIEILHN